MYLSAMIGFILVTVFGFGTWRAARSGIGWRKWRGGLIITVAALAMGLGAAWLVWRGRNNPHVGVSVRQ